MGHVLDGSSLGAMFHAIGTLRIYIALEVSVIPGVGVDERGDGATVIGHLGLDATPRPAVAREYDLAADVHPASLQLLVVGGNPVVHVDHFRLHVTIR